MPIVLEHRPRPIHPFHAVLLAGIIPLFLGVLLNDLAYASSHEVQWKNFASWLLVGGLVFSGLALIWAIVGLFQADRRGAIYFAALLAVWVLGFLNALIHAKDAWASMPEALILSVIVAVFAIVATALGFSTLRAGELK